MKARVKATGEIVDVYCDFRGMKHDFFDENGKGYMSDELTIFDNEDYEQGWNDGYYEAVNTNTDPDYWTRLLHQYAGMAMQGILSNEELFKATAKNAEEFGLEVRQALAIDAKVYATALVEKLKEKEGRK